jgi:hypothetical protein
MLPSLNAGVALGRDYLITGTASGVATKAYYSNQYTLSFLYQMDFGDHWFGDLNVGMGLGGVYGTKAIALNPEADADTDQKVTEQSDIDSGLGPAFRVSFRPLSSFYVAVDYVMSVGPAITGNGWGDVGMFAFGLEI